MSRSEGSPRGSGAPALDLLIVEDEAAHAEAIRRAFAVTVPDAVVRVVGSLRAFHEAVAARPPAIAVIDLKLPDGRAIEALAAGAEAAEFPVVVMTSFGDEQTAVEALKAGALDYVVKSPEAFAAMPRTVEGTLREWRLLMERKASAAALQAGNEKLASIFRAAPVGIGLVRERVILEANDRLCQITGYTRNELLGQNARLLYPSDEEYEFVGREKYRQIAGVGTGTVETRWRCKNGEIIDVVLSSTPIDLRDHGRGVTFTVLDVTEQKRAFAALERSREELRAVYDHAPVLMCVVDAERRVLYANPAFEALTGRSEAELKEDRACGMLGCIHALDDPRGCGFGPDCADCALRLALEDTLTTGRVHRGIERRTVLVRAGVSREIALLGATARLEAGNNPRVLLCLEDVTERARAEDELTLRDNALEAAANAIVITDPEGRIEWANAAFTWLTGYPLDEARGASPRILKSGLQNQGYYRELWRTITAGSAWHGELVNRRKDGTLYPEEMTITPVRDATGVIRHFIAVKQDITERKRLEAELIQAQKMEAVGRLAGGVAHDFNNILQAMMSLAQVLRLRAPSAELVRTSSELEALIRRGASLTQQLLLFSRRKLVEKSRLDLGEVVGAAGVMLRRLIPENIRLTVEIAPQKLWIEGDAGQVQQVLMNLAVNAKDAMPSGGTLTVRTGGDGDAWVEVEDDGAGMSEEVRQHLFEPFFTTKDVGKGTGLGLSVVHGIVGQHGARIEVESSLGRGSRFRVTFPAASAGDATSREPSGEAILPRGHGERVLVVEDEEGARKGLVELLEFLGYEVISTGSGEAVEALGSTPAPDLVLTDLMLPGIDGPELARRLALRWPQARIVFMSGYTEDESVRRGVNDGSMRFLQKPFDINALARELSVALAEPPKSDA
ncbi:MAG: PAS domain S-box protein [Acidobacteria bacterium]|nr:PAS domain S-box protein [Acidobacteriota bacterium]